MPFLRSLKAKKDMYDKKLKRSLLLMMQNLLLQKQLLRSCVETSSPK